MSPTQRRSIRSNKQKQYDETAKNAMGVLSDFPLVIENNMVDSRHGVAMYYKHHVKPLLECLTVNVGICTSSGDDDASYESDEDGKRLRIIEAYSPKKIL